MSDELDLFGGPRSRTVYRPGQRLRALDLSDDQRREAGLRHLHTRVLHETWGVAYGLEVDVETRPGGRTAIVVRPGHALDAAGRELLSSRDVEAHLPQLAVAQTLVLTVRYRRDAAGRGVCDLAAACPGLEPRLERPLFAWRRPDEVRFGPEVPLVQATIANGAVQGELDDRVRRYARPLARPHVGRGTTDPGRSGWRPWIEPEDLELGLEVAVDTSAAGFNEVPLYFASLETGPLGSGESESAAASLFTASFSFVTAATAAGFTFRILNVAGLPFTLPEAADAETQQWIVSWLGLEPAPSTLEP